MQDSICTLRSLLSGVSAEENVRLVSWNLVRASTIPPPGAQSRKSGSKTLISTQSALPEAELGECSPLLSVIYSLF